MCAECPLPAPLLWARRCALALGAGTAAGTARHTSPGLNSELGSKVNKALILNKLAANPTYFWSSLSLNILRVCSGSEVLTESGAVGEVSSFISLFYNLLLQFQGRQIDGITTVWWCHSCRSVWSVRVGVVLFSHTGYFFCWSNSLFPNTSSHKVVSSQQMS